MRDWSREPYRKLLRNPSPSFRMLDALSQGIGYVLMREAGDDGFLPFAESFDEGVKRLAKLVTIPPRQRSIVARCVQDLIADGTLQHNGDRLFVKNLPDINRRRDEAPKGGSKGSSKAPAPTASEPPTALERTVSGPSATPERTVGGTPAALERTTGSTAANLEPTIETDPSDGNYSPESASRARLQVGREVGSKAGRQVAAPSDPAGEPAPTAFELEVRAISEAVAPVAVVCDRCGGADALGETLNLSIAVRRKGVDYPAIAKLAALQVLGEFRDGKHQRPGGWSALVRTVFTSLIANPDRLARAQGATQFRGGSSTAGQMTPEAWAETMAEANKS